MGQKVNPHGLRVGIIKGWDTQWYADKKNYSVYVKQDYDIRTFLKKKYYNSAISRITVERVADRVIVNIFTGRPGVLIGKEGAGVEQMKREAAKFVPGRKVVINVKEIRRVDADAQLVAESVAAQLEKRASFRRTVKQAMGKATRSGAKGVKMMVAGRLDGAEIARCEQYHEGSIPLQTLRADIDYGFAEAHTTFGVIGVKCWIYNGEIIGKPTREGGRA